MQILFAIFGLALLLGIGRAIAGWLRRRRYPDRFDPPPTDPRQDYERTNLTKYNQSLSHMPHLDDDQKERDY